jgi:hypothetical protein
MSEKEAENADAVQPSRIARSTWGCLRACFLSLGLLLVMASGSAIYATIREPGWLLVVAVAFALFGCWLIWAALFGTRRLIERLFVDTLANVLDRLF